MPDGAEERRVLVGCAGWSLPTDRRGEFPAAGTHLQRYATRFPAVEINSSFYRPHRPATYARWAASVPSDFRFSVKVPKLITHQLRLAGATAPLEQFLAEAACLGPRLGCLLVQLPPTLEYDRRLTRTFVTAFRRRFDGHIVWEPRHQSWFGGDAARLLVDFAIARVAADPAVVPAAAEPGGWEGVVYYRLHGSPVMYRSSYERGYLCTIAKGLRTIMRTERPVWCIFDNTTFGAAIDNGLELLALLSQSLGTISPSVDRAGAPLALTPRERKARMVERGPPAKALDARSGAGRGGGTSIDHKECG